MKCVTDGPFANLTCPIGPGWRLNETCLMRNVNDTISLWASREKLDDCTGYGDFANFAPCLYMMPHRGGHGGVGGTVSVSPYFPFWNFGFPVEEAERFWALLA